MDARPETALAPVTRFIQDLRFSDLPANTAKMAGLLMLDTLGVAAAAHTLEAGTIARKITSLLHGSADPRTQARMMFDGRTVSIAGAAFAGATQIDNLDAHDGYNPTKGHIGVAVVPGLVAFADASGNVSGQDALTAFVVGYEVSARAGLALHATVSDYHTSGAWNALGVASIGARLRGLSDDQLRQALGIAEYHGPRSQMMREIDNPSMLHDGSGCGAMTGVTATIMAENGFTGAPAITVEAPDVMSFWSDIGTLWTTDLQYIKPYPICRWAHAPIDCTLNLRAEHGIAHEDVAHIEISTFHESARLFAGMPGTPSIAQYSLPFAVASALVNGVLGIDQITGDGLTDPAVARLVECTSVVESNAHNARFPAGRWADITIRLKDGTEHKSGEVNARGGPEDPLSDDQIIGKYHAYADPTLGAGRAVEIRDHVLGLHQPGSDFKALVELLTKPV